MDTFLPISIVGAAGLFLGIGLAVASKTLKVFIDPKISRIQGILPGANCGACGFPGCSGFARGVVDSKAPTNGCPVGGEKSAVNIADIMGVAATASEPMMAVVNCQGGNSEAAYRAIYDGIADCHAATITGNGSKACPDGCLGLGTCVKSCVFDAITINANGIAVIDHEKCGGCGKCVTACPRRVISMIPQVHKVYLACSNRDKGAKVKKYCSVGCTACTLCVKATESGAITMENNLPKLDYSGDEIFIIAHSKCPSKCFVDLAKMRPKANIDTKCNGCGQCAKVCTVKEAIRGEEGERHAIDKEKCIGCGNCLNICPTRAITLWGGLGYETVDRQKRTRRDTRTGKAV